MVARPAHMAARRQGASEGTRSGSRAWTAGNILTGSEKKIASDMKSFAQVPSSECRPSSTLLGVRLPIQLAAAAPKPMMSGTHPSSTALAMAR